VVLMLMHYSKQVRHKKLQAMVISGSAQNVEMRIIQTSAPTAEQRNLNNL